MKTSRCLSVLFLLLMGSGCSDGTQDKCRNVPDRCTSGTDSPRCSPDGRFVQECQPGSDGCLVWVDQIDCSASGMECQVANAVPRCIGSCTDECLAGRGRCNGDWIQACTQGEEGCLVWEDQTDCAAQDQACDQNGAEPECVSTCTDECAQADETRCQGTLIQTCTLGTNQCLAWVDGVDCASSDDECRMEDGAATCATPCANPCTLDEARCTGGVLERCLPGVGDCLDWTQEDDCEADGRQCQADGTSAQCVCVLSCEPAGNQRCRGSWIQTCELQDNGCNAWVNTGDCAASQETCVVYGGAPMCAGPCGDGVQDGGFEAGSPSAVWTEYSLVYGTVICSVDVCCGPLGCGEGQGPHGGTWWAWFGGYETGLEEGFLEQQVTLPAVGCAVLSFYLQVPVRASNQTDRLTVSLDGVEVFSLVADPAADAYRDAYQKVEIGVNSFADGSAHTLRIASVTDGFFDDFTSFMLDDVKLQAGWSCCLNECETAGSTRCVGWTLQTCTVIGDLLSVLFTEDCATAGMECHQTNGQMAVCETCTPECDTEGERRCNGNLIQICQPGPDACLDWVLEADCAATDQYCRDAGVPPECADYSTGSGGTTCTDPAMLPIEIPALLPVWLRTQTTCGAGNDYSETCLEFYDGGEDFLYQINVTAPAIVNFVMDTKETFGTALSLSSSCPPGTDCIFRARYGAEDQYASGCTRLDVGLYTLMVDTYPSPTCIPDFDLMLVSCDCAEGDTTCLDPNSAGTCESDGTWTSQTCPQGCQELTPGTFGCAT